MTSSFLRDHGRKMETKIRSLNGSSQQWPLGQDGPLIVAWFSPTMTLFFSEPVSLRLWSRVDPGTGMIRAVVTAMLQYSQRWHQKKFL